MNEKHPADLHSFLEAKHDLYNRPDFVLSDPIQIPHRFEAKEDIEIAAFLSATIAWGKRQMIIRNASNMMALMDNAPADFVRNAEDSDLEKLLPFVHRTFNGFDFIYFISSLQNLYRKHGGLHGVFADAITKHGTMREAIIEFRNLFFELPYPERTQKHVANVLKNSAAKRINLFLMWMIRQDKRGVHFGLWKNISPALLMMPIDVHSGNVARKLGLLTRKQNDWKAVEELTSQLRHLDAADPTKYDFALFGLGIFEKF